MEAKGQEPFYSLFFAKQEPFYSNPGCIRKRREMVKTEIAVTKSPYQLINSIWIAQYRFSWTGVSATPHNQIDACDRSAIRVRVSWSKFVRLIPTTYLGKSKGKPGPTNIQYNQDIIHVRPKGKKATKWHAKMKLYVACM